MEKTKFLACKLIYWPGNNSNIENYIKNFSTCLEFQQMQPKEQIMHHKITGKPWKWLEQTYLLCTTNLSFSIHKFSLNI